jgi:hypothetical protein
MLCPELAPPSPPPRPGRPPLDHASLIGSGCRDPESAHPYREEWQELAAARRQQAGAMTRCGERRQ